MKLIVGLGNPGKEYEHTRHNMGFDQLDFFADSHHLSFDREKFGGKYCEFQMNGEKVILLKPQKYINLSGEVIKRFIDFYKIPISNILIICDDLDTEVGKIKLKKQGSSGGHNGLKNIELHLKTKEYYRYKIGISNNKELDGKDYVLGKFSSEEQKKLKMVFETGVTLLNDYFEMSFDNLMNHYNKK
ncbi:MAG: aminoacyl-tRNA hydrolase [Firmicutes bacterium]|nr:aminoacyl-tRNA hydrolase [Bacillota bacterium]